MCVRVCLILIVCITFCYNVICVNYNLCGRLCVQYKFIQLGNKDGLLHVCVLLSCYNNFLL